MIAPDQDPSVDTPPDASNKNPDINGNAIITSLEFLTHLTNHRIIAIALRIRQVGLVRTKGRIRNEIQHLAPLKAIRERKIRHSHIAQGDKEGRLRFKREKSSREGASN